MHYKNGRSAVNGDKVLLIPLYGAPVVGILYDAVAGNDTCNGKLAPCAPNDPCPNLKECLHIEDVGEIKHVVMPTEQKAGIMYEAYCVAVGGKAFNGDPLPDWQKFRSDATKEKQSSAWIAAAQAV